MGSVAKKTMNLCPSDIEECDHWLVSGENTTILSETLGVINLTESDSRTFRGQKKPHEPVCIRKWGAWGWGGCGCEWYYTVRKNRNPKSVVRTFRFRKQTMNLWKWDSGVWGWGGTCVNSTMMSEFPETLVKTHRIIVVYYESMKRKIKIKPIYEWKTTN